MDFKSPDHDNNSDGNDTSSTDVPSALSPRQWFQSKSTNKERLNFPEFVRAMGYWREQDAHDAFMNILSLEIFPRKVWEAAINDYEVWRLNDGREFWASRAISSQMSMSAKRTAVSIITRGESIIKLLDDSRQDSGIEDLTGSYKVGQKHPRDPSGYEGARLPKTQRSRYEEDEVEDDVRNDGDSANTDDHNVAEQGTGSTSFDQDPLFSTTSSEAIRSSKQTTTSSLELFDLPPETDALVCPPITGDHLTDTPPVTITVTGGLTDTESDPCGQLAAGTSISQNQGQSRSKGYSS
ncbi:hypothetical protein EDD21DRAFT_419864 [Dissophora ornata]|nr:hypothetical protein EDD21DRAFT_419864 [Dissophora ornata]